MSDTPRTGAATLDILWDEMYRAIRVNRDGQQMISLRAAIEAEAVAIERARIAAAVEALLTTWCPSESHAFLVGSDAVLAIVTPP